MQVLPCEGLCLALWAFQSPQQVCGQHSITAVNQMRLHSAKLNWETGIFEQWPELKFPVVLITLVVDNVVLPRSQAEHSWFGELSVWTQWLSLPRP